MWNSAWLDSENKNLFSKISRDFPHYRAHSVVAAALSRPTSRPLGHITGAAGHSERDGEREREKRTDYGAPLQGDMKDLGHEPVFLIYFFPHRQINVQTGLNCCRDAP